MRKEYLRELMLVGLLFLLLLSALSSCKKDEDNAPAPSANQPTNEVWMQGMSFSPGSITVSVNTTIIWKNKESITHTVTANDGSFNSGNIGNGGIYSHQFTMAGTYPYHCTLHSGMTGQVVVH